MLVPKFKSEESWGGNGNVDIWFMDNTSHDLRERVFSEINDVIPKLHKHQRTVYHMDRIVNNIFLNMSRKGNLRRNRKNKQWVWAEEVGNDSRHCNDNIQKCR